MNLSLQSISFASVPSSVERWLYSTDHKDIGTLLSRYRWGLLSCIPLPSTQEDCQVALLTLCAAFLVYRSLAVFITSPAHNKAVHLGPAIGLPVLLIFLTSWDLYVQNPLWVSLLRVFGLSGLHFVLNQIKPFMNSLPFVQLNSELSHHYEGHTYFSKKYGPLFGWGTFALLSLSMNIMFILLGGYPLLRATLAVLWSVPLLVSSIASITDAVLILKAPYPANTVFRKHGVPVRFMPVGQAAAKVFIACGRIASAGAKAGVAVASAIGSLIMADVAYSQHVGKAYPFYVTQLVQKKALSQLGVDVGDNPTWKQIGQWWDEQAKSRDQK